MTRHCDIGHDLGAISDLTSTVSPQLYSWALTAGSLHPPFQEGKKKKKRQTDRALFVRPSCFPAPGRGSIEQQKKTIQEGCSETPRIMRYGTPYQPYRQGPPKQTEQGVWTSRCATQRAAPRPCLDSDQIGFMRTRPMSPCQRKFPRLWESCRSWCQSDCQKKKKKKNSKQPAEMRRIPSVYSVHVSRIRGARLCSGAFRPLACLGDCTPAHLFGKSKHRENNLAGPP
jgi:hypothetical protein